MACFAHQWSLGHILFIGNTRGCHSFESRMKPPAVMHCYFPFLHRCGFEWLAPWFRRLSPPIAGWEVISAQHSPHITPFLLRLLLSLANRSGTSFEMIHRNALKGKETISLIVIDVKSPYLLPGQLWGFSAPFIPSPHAFPAHFHLFSHRDFSKA